jgi:proteasome lid subunit RPN8/RPN11
MRNQQDITLLIPKAIYTKLFQYVAYWDEEITGFADVFYDKALNNLIMGELYLLPQQSADTEVEMDEEAISEFTVKCIQMGMEQLPRLWWHSHVNMATFFSGTDYEAIDNLKNDTFQVALVVNKQKQMHALLRVNQPITVVVEPLGIEVLEEEEIIPQEIIDEVENKVKRAPVKSFNTEKDEVKPIFYKSHSITACNKMLKECEVCTEYYDVEIWGKDKGYES